MSSWIIQAIDPVNPCCYLACVVKESEGRFGD
jgi:hypothetical protein